jgi:transposase
VNHGAPKDKRDYNMMKIYDFPVATRINKKNITLQDIKDFIKRHKKDKPAFKRYANFYFILYLSKVLDIQVIIIDKFIN